MRNTQRRRFPFALPAILTSALGVLVSTLLDPAIQMCTTGGIDQGGGICSTSRSPLLSLFDLAGLTVTDSTWSSISQITLVSSLLIALGFGLVALFMIGYNDRQIASGKLDRT